MFELSIGLLACLALMAALYTSVGHGGASGYIAMMTLFAFPIDQMRPLALALNLVAAGYAAFIYIRAGRFQPRLFVMLTLAAMPFAFWGAGMPLPVDAIKFISGICLLVSVAILLWQALGGQVEGQFQIPAWPIVAGTGAGLGFLAGVTGTGGGIFLSPVMIFGRWIQAKATTGTVALFIWCNSLAGLLGAWPKLAGLNIDLVWPLMAVGIGALMGTYISLNHFAARGIRLGLSIVLSLAAFKLLA